MKAAESNEPAFQGIEKSIFYRLCRLLALNVQLLFIFDGPKRPWKRGRPSGKIDYEKLKLLKELLRYFRIPYHEAPAEAEAECARLQILGVVDAVWSQDSDTLMFGCDFHIRDDRVAKDRGNNDRSKENTKKSGKSVRVIRGREIRDEHSLDREGLVLFAMLCGGDYDLKGLPQCGPAAAMGAVKAGLGKTLCQCRTKADCLSWRDELVDCLQKARFHGFVPYTFPDTRTLNKYYRPTISTDEQLRNLHMLRNGWDGPIDETKLLELTSSRFNIWGRLYMNWVGPVLLTKYLVARDASLPREHIHEIRLTKRRVKKNDEQAVPPLERNLTFSPFGLTTLQKKDFEGERAGYWTSAISDPFDPDHRVEWEIPEYLLQKVLPPEVLNPPPAAKKTPQKRKRKAHSNADDDETGATVPKSKRTVRTKPRKENSPPNTSQPRPGRTPPAHSANAQGQSSAAPLRPIQGNDYINLLSSDDEAPRPTESYGGEVIDLGSESEDSEDEMEQLNRAIRLSLVGKSPFIESTPTNRSRRPAPKDDIAWVDWEEDPESLFVPTESPIQMGTKRATIMPSFPATASALSPDRQSKEPVKHTGKKPLRAALEEPPNQALSSPRFTSTLHQPMASNYASPSLRPASSMPKETLTASRSQLDIVDEGGVPSPKSVAQLRAARLQFFNSNRAAPIDSPSASLTASPLKCVQNRHTLSKQDAPAKVTQETTDIEVIDLTDL